MNALPLVLVAALGQYGPWVGVGMRGPSGGVATYSGALDWSRSWSADWGSGIPAPSIDCVADAAGGGMTCVGATATANGATTTTTSAGYPERTAAITNGTTFFDLGAVAQQAGSFTVLAAFRSDAVTDGKVLLGKETTGNYSWSLYYSLGTLTAGVRETADASKNSTYTLGSVNAGVGNVACFSYTYATSGTSVMRGNMNGTAAADKTDALGPPNATTAPLRFGGRGSTTLLDGIGASFTRVSIWTGTGLTAAQCALAVASQQARAIAKPAATTATVTSPTTTCAGASGTLYSLPAGSLCCGASGCEVWGAAQHSNLLSQSSPTAWSNSASGAAAPTVLSTTATAPDGTATALKTSIPAVNAGQRSHIYAAFTASAVAHSGGVWLKGDAPGTTNLWFEHAGTGAATGSIQCPITTSWSQCKIGGTLSATTFWLSLGTDTQSAGHSASAAVTLYAWGGEAQPSSVLGPYVATSGAPVSGTADAASVATTITNPAKWCVGVKATPAAAWTNNTDGLFGLAETASGVANTAYLSKGAFFVYDASAGSKLVAWSPSGTSAKKVVACAIGGVLTVYADGQIVSGAASGPGAGVMASLPSKVWIGRGYGSGYEFNGSVEGICQGSSYAAVAKCLARLP